MNTQITHFIRQHVSQPDRLGNICASNTRSQHVRSELVLRPPQLGGGDVLRFLIGTIAISCNETSRAFGFIQIVSAAVPPIENRVSCCPVSVRVCVSVFVGVLVCLPVFVCENLFMPNARINHMKEIKKERNSNTKQIIFSVYKKTTKRILRKWQKQKSNQHLKCWICLLFRLIAIPIDRDVVRHVARKTFSFATEIEAIRLIAWLIYFCTWFATHAPRRATWLALQLHRSIDPSIARLQFQLESKWSCLLRVELEEAACLLSSSRSCALRRGSNYVDLCTVRLHRSFDGTKSIDAVDREEICNAKNENWFDDRARLIYNVPLRSARDTPPNTIICMWIMLVCVRQGVH